MTRRRSKPADHPAVDASPSRKKVETNGERRPRLLVLPGAMRDAPG